MININLQCVQQRLQLVSTLSTTYSGSPARFSIKHLANSFTIKYLANSFTVKHLANSLTAKHLVDSSIDSNPQQDLAERVALCD